MRIIKLFIALFVVAFSFACSGNPVAPVTHTLAQASIVMASQSNAFSLWHGSLQNVGSGCAANVTGAIRVVGYPDTRLQLTSVGASTALGSLRPGEIVAVWADVPSSTISQGVRIFPTWTNVACPVN